MSFSSGPSGASPRNHHHHPGRSPRRLTFIAMEEDVPDSSSAGGQSRTTRDSGIPSISLDVAAWPQRDSSPGDHDHEDEGQHGLHSHRVPAQQRFSQQSSQPSRSPQQSQGGFSRISPRSSRRYSRNWPFLRDAPLRSPVGSQNTHSSSNYNNNNNNNNRSSIVRSPIAEEPGSNRSASAAASASASASSPSPAGDMDRSHRIIRNTSSGPPSLYWSDDGATIATVGTAAATNPSAYTFYREEDEENDDASSTRPSHFKRGRTPPPVMAPGLATPSLRPRDTADYSFVDGRYIPPALRQARMADEAQTTWPLREKPVVRPLPSRDSSMDEDEEESRSCMRRRRVWLVLLLLFLLIAAGVGAGVGVGVGVHASQRSSSTSASASVSSSASASAPVSSTSAAEVAATASADKNAATVAAATTTTTTTTSKPKTATHTVEATTTPTSTSSSASRSTGLTDCPGANNTEYSVPGSDKTFKRLCGVDFSGFGGAVDLSNLPTKTVEDCMNNCAGTSGCTGCAWGPLDSQDTSGDFLCYLKSTLGKSHKADSDWCFAILQE